MALIFAGTNADDVIDERNLGPVAPGDAVDGGGGQDLFILTSGNLWVLGGEGNDTIDGSRVSGQIPVSYAAAPKGIVFDAHTGRAQDGTGSVDALIGSTWWVFGSQHDDVIRISSGQIYALDGNDTLEGGIGAYIVPGSGADVISGERLTVSYLDDPAPIQGRLQDGWVIDGWGFRDTLRGASTLMLGRAGSNIVGTTTAESFEIPNGGNHTIDGGGGDDRLKVNRSVSEYEIAAQGAAVIFTHKVTGERLTLSNLKVMFADRTVDVTKPIPRFDSFKPDQTLDLKAFVQRGAWPNGDGVGSCTLPVTLDFNGDGRLDFVFHLYQGQSAAGWGAYSDAPTPNTLLVFLSQPDGRYVEATSTLFPVAGSEVLTGASRKVSVGDLNGDGKPDWAYALNREDGRSGNPAVSNTSKAVVVLSTSGSTYTTMELGEPNWYHQVLIDSTLFGKPTAIFAGYYRSLDTTLQPSGLTVGAGFGYQWNATGSSFGAAFAVPGHPNTFATLKSPTGQPQMITVYNEITAAGSKQALALIEPAGNGWALKDVHVPYGSKIVNFVGYNGDRGTAELFELSPGVLGIAAGYSESIRMALRPGDESTTVFKFSAAQVSAARSDGYWYQNDGVAVQLLDFFRSTGSGIERLPVRLVNEDRMINSNFMEALDFNRDGLQDLVVYAYIEGGQPRVYLNTGGDLLVRIDETMFPMAPLDWGAAATSKIADFNGDGLWDVLLYPANGFSKSTDSHLLWQTHLGVTAFDSSSISTDLEILSRLDSTRIQLWSGNDTVLDVGQRAGTTTIDGGAGLDRLVYSGPRSAYNLEVAEGGRLTVTRSLTQASDQVQNVERLHFADTAIALDWNGVAGRTYRLYEAAFDRKPDAGGVGFWMYYLDRGFDPVRAAENFLASQEFRTLYDDNPNEAGFQEPTVESFVTKLYRNVLGRDPEGPGYQFWVDAMNNKGGAFGKAWSRAEVLLQFAESAENMAQLIGVSRSGFEFQPYTPPLG